MNNNKKRYRSLLSNEEQLRLLSLRVQGNLDDVIEMLGDILPLTENLEARKHLTAIVGDLCVIARKLEETKP